ncbi:multicopper oxidase domain-containing protein [Sphaerisporangium rubeum]|uniref:Bilirubin oxidase n=1 Tax=Sphaerisporangium rubeum TaxID=321317 RepID=A0A7X0I911_9ACTN|nr:multicopper oxidase [Sphaerisporangium rubeum]MBB6470836.1 bilirubin oxidase [Sphaerisporangium rubeum]
MITRRRFLQAGAAALLAGRRFLPAGILDPASVAKYVTPLTVPPMMPALPADGPGDHYLIGVRRFRQQILPSGSPPTTVWGYGSVRHPRTFNSPGFTVEATAGRPVRIEWVNELVDRDGNHLEHLLPVDPTLHWANPPGGAERRDSRPAFTATPGRYRGPVPIVTHLHGGHSDDESDGYPEAWYLPVAKDIPSGYATEGTWYATFRDKFAAAYGTRWAPGTAVAHYANDQRPATLWYHDHALGITRLNVYAGLAGFYLLRGGPEDLPAGVLPGPSPGANGTRHHEIPVVVQDRSFAADGSLYYPGRRRGFTGPYVPHSDVPPIWNPEFFAAAMTVNGSTWPYLDVEPRRYRLRFLNGCNGRVLDLKIVTDPVARRPAPPVLPFWQIGSDGGYLPAPVRLDRLLMAPAERADVIVDFTGLRAGTEFYLINEGPDGPFQGDPRAAPADPETTGQVMKFVVGRLTGPDRTVPPDRLTLPRFTPVGAATATRSLGLVEKRSTVRGAGPVANVLATVVGDRATVRMWSDPVTENPAVGSVEIWEIRNLTADAHPIHIHEVQFQVVDRRPFTGGVLPPEPWERGLKDTVIAYPRQVTRVRASFDRAGRFVWHCHLLEHEDNEMMRPYVIG